MTPHRLILTYTVVALFAGCDKQDHSTNAILSGTWVEVRVAQTGPFYHAIKFLSPLNGIVVGDSGTVLRTTNGGDTWLAAQTGTIRSLNCVGFSRGGILWVGSHDASLGKSTDLGASWSWTTVGTDSTATVMSICFSDPSHGWLGDNKGHIYHTTDDGTTWTPQNSGTTWAITSIRCINENDCFATSVQRTLLQTTDGGNNWSTVDLKSAVSDDSRPLMFTDIAVLSADHMWIATNAAASGVMNPGAPVLRWSASSQKWDLVETSETWGLTAIQFVDDLFGWAVGFGGISRSTDGGRTWAYQLEGSQSIFVGVSMVGRMQGWALTFSGSVYRYH